MAKPQQMVTKVETPPISVSLGTVVRGKVDSPSRTTIFGVEGIGKSSFAAGAPGVLFLDAEKGTTKLDVARVDVDSWPHLFAWVDELTRAEHDYKTIAFDTLDAMEQMCWRHLCETRRWDGIDAPGYGTGYTAALEQWRELLSRLERLQTKRGVDVIFCAHALVKPFKNPEGDDYERYTLRLHEKSAGLLKGWCYTVLFAQYETFAVKNEKKQYKGVSSGNRLIRTQRTAAWDAKNRDDLPESLPLDWQAFADAVAENASPEGLRARITALAATVDEEKRGKVEAAVAAKPEDAVYLARVLNKLQTQINLNNQENS